ncbi:DUF4190 domain-containing protein [Streptomyces qinzhouensis]|uniref:DUF4190 domain-containing protein n=2 Tax=Streptomyces qinzhouensis TaxID=2599401 RepID=A0A5B8JGP5_9ACTN|nr:DUF4190 domain-containing protein [Streptomyces qinzhouensis]
MGITALVLGIIGIVLGLAVFLFWLSWLPALLAVIFGIIGLSYVRKGTANNRGMALGGVIMGGIGLLLSVGGGVISVLVVKGANDSAEDNVLQVEASAEAEDREAVEKAEREAEAAAAARRLSFGEPFLFENGLKVTVEKPKPFEPDEFANGHAKGNKAIEVTITVVNTGKKPAPIESMPYVFDAAGADTDLVIDGSGRQKILHDSIPPGKQAIGRYAFSLPPTAANRAEVEFTPVLMDLNMPDARWSGSL